MNRALLAAESESPEILNGLLLQGLYEIVRSASRTIQAGMPENAVAVRSIELAKATRSRTPMQQARTLQIYGSPALSISYQQFFVYDSSEKLPGSLWSEQHFAQGFVRRPHAICFGTLLEYGLAAIAAYVGVPEDLSKYDRVIRVPLSVISGKINFEGPEEYPIVREVHLPPNTYRVYCAQTVTAVGYDVDLFFEEADISQDRSCILKADEIVDAKGALLETGEVAQ